MAKPWDEVMSLLLTFVLLMADAANAGEPSDLLFTAPGAVLCVQPDNVWIANHPQLIGHDTILRGMGCIRTPAGIRTQLIEKIHTNGPWMVRFYPKGISQGVTLWALPSAFATISA
jgi:hypothetical protein